MTTKDTIAVWAEAFNGDKFIMGNTETSDGLPWERNSADLANFREVTRDRLLIMGRNTFNLLPDSMKTEESLSERPIVIITHNPEEQTGRLFSTGILEIDPNGWHEADAGTTMRQLVSTLSLLAGNKQVAIIGGPSVIEFFEDAIDRLVVTMFTTIHSGDVYAPTQEFLVNFPRTIAGSKLAEEAWLFEYLRAEVIDTDSNTLQEATS